jgi:ABC-2 type transport system ATP-binding protein
MHRGVEVWDLKKSFNRTRWSGFRRNVREIAAVQGVSLRIPMGQSVAFIGPNGSGKSTTIKMLMGLLPPSGGDARVLGLIPWRERKHLDGHIGSVFGKRSHLWHHLSLSDSLELLSKFHSLKRAQFVHARDRLVERFELGSFLEAPVATLLPGQIRRAELAASLLHRPKVLFLDEPTIGLDVAARQQFRDLIREWNRYEGTTVCMASHDPGDVEHVADRMVVMSEGQVVADDQITELRRRYFNAPLEKVIARIYRNQVAERWAT